MPTCRFKEIIRLEGILIEKQKEKAALEAEKSRLQRKERLMKLQVSGGCRG